MSRVNAREAALTVAPRGRSAGWRAPTAAPAPRGLPADPRAQAGLLADLDVADALYGGAPPRRQRHDPNRPRRRHRRRRRHPARRPRRRRVLGQRARGPLRDQRGRPGALGSGALLRPRPARAREDLLEDRRLGARLGLGPARLEAADAAEGHRRDGRRARSGRSPARAWRCRRRLARAAARPRPHRGDPRQRDGRREALPHRAADRVPRARPRARAPRASRRCRPTCARDRARAAPNMDAWLPRISEDTMPGELANCTAGRVANLFNLHGPNFTVDAACASAMAAMDAAIEGLVERDFDVAITGGVDRNMGASTLREVLRDRRAVGHRHAPLRRRRRRLRHGRGRRRCSCSSAWPTPSATATASTPSCAASAAPATARARASPRPTRSGQRLAVERAWRNSGSRPRSARWSRATARPPASATSSRSRASMEAFAGAGLEPGSIALGSVKSNIGHLKAAAGAAGILKTALALHDKVLPPSLNFERPNPNVDWSASPFAVNTELREWEVPHGAPRVAGVSAFGFGGTNFHIVMEEHVPGHLTSNGTAPRSPCRSPVPGAAAPAPPPGAAAPKPPLRGALVLGAADEAALANELRTALAEARQGRHLEPAPPSAAALRAPRADRDRLRRRRRARRQGGGALKRAQAGNPPPGRRCAGAGSSAAAARAGKVAFLYTGQGSQYANMLADLRARAGRRRDLRRGRRDHGAAARGPPAVGHHLRRPRRPGRGRARRGRAAAHRDHAAGRAHRRHRRSRACSPSTGSRRTWSWATRSASTARSSRRRALVRGRARGRQRPRARDGEPARSTTPGRWPP